MLTHENQVGSGSLKSVEMQSVMEGLSPSATRTSNSPTQVSPPEALWGPRRQHLRRRVDEAFQWVLEPWVQTTAFNLLLILTWYFLSTCLSLWNKQLVGKEHGVLGLGPFPAPMLLTAVQFMCQHLMARGVLAARRYMSAAPRSEAMTWPVWWKKVVPNGVSTGLDIGLSNYSLMLITLSFYTMCKSTTPVFLLSFAFIWGIERPSWSLAGVVSVICSGLVLLVAGETEFNMVGFLAVMTASMLAGFRWTVTQVLLQGDNHHGAAGGPVNVLYSLTPVMSVTVLIMSLVVERLWVVLPGSPYFSSVASCALTFAIMMLGGIIAFIMVWVEFKVIQETSALTFMVAGTFKELVTVFSAVVFLHEPFTAVNALGLVILIFGVILFNWTKYRKMKEQRISEESFPAKSRAPTASPIYALVDPTLERVAADEEGHKQLSRPSSPHLTTPTYRTNNSSGLSSNPFNSHLKEDGSHAIHGLEAL